MIATLGYLTLALSFLIALYGMNLLKILMNIAKKVILLELKDIWHLLKIKMVKMF